VCNTKNARQQHREREWGNLVDCDNTHRGEEKKGLTKKVNEGGDAGVAVAGVRP
jgi:hypothetical protein